MNTRGGDTITITGTNFGPAQGYWVDRLPKSEQLVVEYGNYSAVNCRISVAHTVVECQTQELTAVGKDLAWTVTVGDGKVVQKQSSTAFGQTAYIIPSVAEVYGPGMEGGSTFGGQTFFIRGDNMGASSSLTVKYWSAMSNFIAQCSIDQAHTLLKCTSDEGTGFNHRWQVTVGGQASDMFHSNTSYGPPVLTSFRRPDVHVDQQFEMSKMNTEGSERIEITGTQFGSVAENAISSVKFGKSGTSVKFEAVSAAMTTKSTVKD